MFTRRVNTFATLLINKSVNSSRKHPVCFIGNVFIWCLHKFFFFWCYICQSCFFSNKAKRLLLPNPHASTNHNTYFRIVLDICNNIVTLEDMFCLWVIGYSVLSIMYHYFQPWVCLRRDTVDKNLKFIIFIDLAKSWFINEFI